MPSERITLQHLTPDTSLDPILQRDARITGTGMSQPPSILLDFIYGVAAYLHWGVDSEEIDNVLKNHYDNRYGAIPAPEPQVASDSEHEDISQFDDDDDEDYKPPGRNNRSKKMHETMDKILKLSTLMKGAKPELEAPQRQQEDSEAVMRAEEDNKIKVNQWQKSQAVCSSLRFLNSP